jgi:signal-transduction protein with cAMP-binding, CBS, and nucleotidyltransferase domain
MSTQIKDYMTKELNTIEYNATVTDAAKVMAADNNAEGYVIILKNFKPIGIITERDIVNKVIAKDGDSSKTKISDIMSTPLITIDPNDDLLNASKVMRENNVRKLAVVKGDIIYGIITAKDIAQQGNKYVERTIRELLRWTTPFAL